MTLQEEYLYLINSKNLEFNSIIKEFWKNQGYNIEIFYPNTYRGGSVWRISWIGKLSGGRGYIAVATSDMINNLDISKAKINYSFKENIHKVYSENEALRYLKLKAFL
jgi:hypothetical protein